MATPHRDLRMLIFPTEIPSWQCLLFFWEIHYSLYEKITTGSGGLHDADSVRQGVGHPLAREFHKGRVTVSMGRIAVGMTLMCCGVFSAGRVLAGGVVAPECRALGRCATGDVLDCSSPPGGDCATGRRCCRLIGSSNRRVGPRRGDRLHRRHLRANMAFSGGTWGSTLGSEIPTGRRLPPLSRSGPKLCGRWRSPRPGADRCCTKAMISARPTSSAPSIAY